MFIKLALENPFIYFLIVFTLIFSIVLHELAHGFAAIYEGDDTPHVTGHITLNPMVHLGAVSLCCAFVFGIVWGLMPLNPDQFRHGRWGHALVALAGPMTNLAIALQCCLYLKKSTYPDSIVQVLVIVALINFLIGFVNLLPLPGLDGFCILLLIFPDLKPISYHPLTFFANLFLLGLLTSGAFGLDAAISKVLINLLTYLTH
ncbi:MAG: site-2 protease family protein [Snowella sp.]|nr:site-2 protease family protein [Snowella sp.]